MVLKFRNIVKCINDIPKYILHRYLFYVNYSYYIISLFLVETCKPNTLRRRLFGCPNLLEVVKFLIQHVDINKLTQDASNEKSRFECFFFVVFLV